MKINKIIVPNFRSIRHAEILPNDYDLLIGENNAGKTSIITAIRMFYEYGGLKYNASCDFPKFKTADEDSWIEIEYLTTHTDVS